MVQSLPPTRQIRPDDRDELLIPLASGVRELLFSPTGPFQNRPAFVAGPTPETGLAAAVQSVTRLNCRLWASRDKSGFSNRVNQYNGEVCNPYLEAIGENPTGGNALPPFRGGQCCGVTYQLTYSFRNPNTGLIQDSTQTFTDVQILGTFERSNQPAQPTKSGGVRIRRCDTGEIQDVPLGTTFEGAPLDQSISNVTIVGGAPDTCGNPPVLIQPPGTVVPTTPIVPTIDIDLPGVGPVTINVDIDASGNLVIVAPDIGAEVTLSPKLEIDPDIDVGGGGGGGGAPPLEPEVGEPIESPPGGGGGGDDTGFGEPPEGRIWVGAYVQLLGDLVPFGVIPRDLLGQAALSTVVGNASLNVQDDGGSLLRSTFTQIRSEWSEHIVPVVGLPVTGIRVKVNPSLGYRVYPVSVVDPLAEA